MARNSRIIVNVQVAVGIVLLGLAVFKYMGDGLNIISLINGTTGVLIVIDGLEKKRLIKRGLLLKGLTLLVFILTIIGSNYYPQLLNK